MLMKSFVANTSILILITTFTLNAFEKLQYYDSSNGGNNYDDCLLGDCLDESLEFIQILYSRKNLKEEVAFLEELESLQREFSVCNIDSKKLLLVNKVIGVLKQLAKSEKIIKDSKLCAKFEVFLTKTLFRFGFNQEAIVKFIYKLNLNSNLRWGYLKAKDGCKIVIKTSVYLLILVVTLTKIFKLPAAARYYFYGNFSRDERTNHEIFKGLTKTFCKKVRYCFSFTGS